MVGGYNTRQEEPMLGGEVIEDEEHHALEGRARRSLERGDYQEGGSEKTGCAIEAQPVS
jgi:hypothetical protein